AACLRSLLAQTDTDFQVIVIDDHSTDRTREIAGAFPGIHVVRARPLPHGWTGKNNAIMTGVQEARSAWLLFTDADTIHRPGSLARALVEAKDQDAAMLSYSPEQIVETLWEKAIMPVIFAELASRYDPSKASDPNSLMAAANGQYILIRSDVYDSIGGHESVATDLLEDVALARGVKQSGGKIVFRYGGDAVRTRMYRSFAQLREGWSKNLALLFPEPARLALWRFLEFVFVAGCVVLFAHALLGHSYWLLPVYAAGSSLTFFRVRKAHFSWDANLLAWVGLPVFSYLLLRSSWLHRRKSISWKGRQYASAKPGIIRASLPRESHGLSHTQS
ncbi:MAG TPA: glycosyltransferase family 2 protein, partial [Candidatus Sulfotelmatobacter sp.]